MITISIEDAIFVLCALLGGGLLLITVVFDDILSGIFDAIGIGFDFGGVSLIPLALSFVAMFGVGGIFATQVLDMHAGPAAIVGVASGSIGLGLNYALFSFLRRSEGSRPFSTQDLVGHDAFVVVAIPARRFGTISVRAEGQTHEYPATSTADIPAGGVVRITGVAGAGFMVEAVAAPTAAPTAAGPAPSAAGSATLAGAATDAAPPSAGPAPTTPATPPPDAAGDGAITTTGPEAGTGGNDAR